jgi:hypothetical protein
LANAVISAERASIRSSSRCQSAMAGGNTTDAPLRYAALMRNTLAA